MDKKELSKRLKFGEFIAAYEQCGDEDAAFSVGRIRSITINAHQACTIVIGSPEGRHASSLQITVYSQDFLIGYENKDGYVGQYVLFSYMKRYEQIWLHAFTPDVNCLLQDVIPEKYTTAFESSIGEDQIEILHHKKRARYKRPLFTLFAMFLLWKKRKKLEKKKEQTVESNVVITIAE